MITVTYLILHKFTWIDVDDFWNGVRKFALYSISNKFSKTNFGEQTHQNLTPTAFLKAKLFQFFFEVATVVLFI